ncbi:MAG: hypothetical protein CL608_26365 [Anaerolineaceae bacterium]|nr:hypothetical protein [Anaerolineaceae bacterium]
MDKQPISQLATSSSSDQIQSFAVLEPYDTGRQCVCADCQGSFVGWYVIEGKGHKQTKRAHPEAQCSQCDCRLVNDELHPCPDFDDPRSGIRYTMGTPEAASVTRLDWYAIKRLQVLFPGITIDQMFAIAPEIVLYLSLREIFPDATLGWLQQIRASLIAATCPRCGQPLPWVPALTSGAKITPVHPPAPNRPKARLLRHRGRFWSESTPESLSLF